MAFTEKHKFDGLLGGADKLGEVVSVYGQRMASLAIPGRDVLIYDRGNDGEWSLLKNFSVSIPVSTGGSSMVMYKDICFYSLRKVSGIWISMLFPDDGYTSATIASKTGLDGQAEDYGSDLSVSDDYVVVGAPQATVDGFVNAGKVYIWDKSGESWTTAKISDQETISATVPDVNEYFGSSVSIYGDTIVVGAPGSFDGKGSVYIFKKNELTGLFEQVQQVIASDGLEGDSFGCSISLYDDYFAVGAENASMSEIEKNVGAVYIFTYSTIWNELRKITSVNESGLIANNFGHSVEMKGDYLIVGSPNAKNNGVADVFYKKRNWGHLIKIESDSVSDGDGFGTSVSIDYPYLVVGAPLADSEDGSIYVFEDPPVRLRLAQEFDVNGEFLPSKASVYLKRSGNNVSSSWSLQSTRDTIIDASNFSTIEQSTNKIIFDDRINGYTGDGYMSLAPDDVFEILDGSDSSFPVINYPIRNSVPTAHNVWFRVHTGSSDPSGSSDFSLDMLLDGVVVKSLSSTIANDEWSWIGTTLVLPDTQQHILGVKIKEKSSIIDKIYIGTDDSFTPENDGPSYITSPYVTVHMKLYNAYGYSAPVDPLYVYDYKTTLVDVIQDDWYNFDISIMDSRGGYSIKEDYTSNFFLVMASSGSNADNFVLWELIDKDEYSSQNSAIKI